MHTPLDTHFRSALDEAKAGLMAAFKAETEKAPANRAVGASALFIALQARAQEQADVLAGSLLEAAESPLSRPEFDREAALESAFDIFDQFIQFAAQSYEAESRQQSQARRVSAPPIHSSLFRIPRQRLSAGFAENLARPPLTKRLTQLFGQLRGAG